MQADDLDAHDDVTEKPSRAWRQVEARGRMLRWLTIEKFAAESGYTPDAVRSKIKRGDWLEGQVWVKAPDGRVLVDTEGYEQWVTSQVYEPQASPR